MGPLASTLVPFVLGMTWLRGRTRRRRAEAAR
jgi:hypothetical protein